MNAPMYTSPRRIVLWWVLFAVLTATAGEAEYVRRAAGPVPAVCIGSSLLLQGTTCRPTPASWSAERP